MAMLYVENVPEEIYKALRKRARANRKSIAAEVISLLEQNIPTEAELKRRREFYDRMAGTWGTDARRSWPISLG